MIRAFFAVFPGAEIANAYAALHARCVERHRGLRWVRPGNLHVTVQFLGDTDERLLDDLRPAIGAALASLGPLRLLLGEPGAFGARDRPRTLWLGLAGEVEAMAEVVRRVQATTGAAGVPQEERPWSPHLTIARNPRGAAAPGWQDIFHKSDLPGSALTVENVALVASSLQAGGPVYSTLWSSPLGRAAPSTPQHAT